MNTFQKVLRSLNNAGAEFVVIGGHAVMFHGYPRSTDDLDLLYPQSADNSEKLARAIAPFVPGVAPADFMGPKDEFAIIRTGSARIALLPEIDGVDTKLALSSAIHTELFGEPVRMISRALLIANKSATSRLKDKADVEELEARAESTDGDTE